ncbi:MAG: RNA pseudouridine synthase [Gammaproteobacteria bacterium]|nr:RNA pseudouridine synthase [Gammaproteobacteria bacterium]
MKVLFENSELVALDKPSGISVLRDRSGASNFFDQIKQQFRGARLVHRLDKFTSGVMIVAKNRASQSELSKAFATRKVTKHYLCVVAGHFPGGRTLKIDLPLKAGRKSRYRVAGLREEIRPSVEGWLIQTDQGLESVTEARLFRQGPDRSMLVCQPKTGRTHQIRVHLSWIGHAIVGDHLYGSTNSPVQSWKRLALHAHKICIPQLSKSISAPVPQDFAEALDYSSPVNLR